MSGTTEGNTVSCPREATGASPPLCIELPKVHLPRKSKGWNNSHLPVDILLLTVEDCEFLSCYTYMKNPYRSYHDDLGYVYFGDAGCGDDEPLKTALVKCNQDGCCSASTHIVSKNAVMVLRPKAVFWVGCCVGLNEGQTKLGDVVISSTCTREAHKTPVNNIVKYLKVKAADGWEPPLENPDSQDVRVHCGGQILVGMDQDTAKGCQELHPKAIAVDMEGEG